MRRNTEKSNYLTIQELTQAQRRENTLFQITGRLDNQQKILVSRMESTLQPSGQGMNPQSNMGGINQQLVNKLRNLQNPALRGQVKNLISTACSEINFNNFDNAYNQISQALKLLEQA